MTRTRFHQGLDDLKQKLLAMGGMAEQAVERAVRAYQTRDLSLCEVVLRDESKINAAERDVDEMSIDLLAMQQPMAIDLRFIVACIKINADLERVGDQAVNIAERVMDLLTRPDPGSECRYSADGAAQHQHGSRRAECLSDRRRRYGTSGAGA